MKTAKSKLTVEQAFARWKAGEHRADLAKLVGKPVTAQFRKLAGTPAEFKKIWEARKVARRAAKQTTKVEKKGATKNA